MEPLLPEIPARHKVQFPDTRTMIVSLIEKFQNTGFNLGKPIDELIEFCFKKLEIVHDAVTNYHPDKIGDILKGSGMSLEKTDNHIIGMTSELEARWKAHNEFFTIFDMSLGKEVHIDKRMDALLGLKSGQFLSATQEALDTEKTIYYQEDLFHTMRAAMICYLVMTMPGFRWESLRDHYLVRFRLTTRNSDKESIRKLPYVTVEKRCYFLFNAKSDETRSLQYHFDRYTVYTDLEEDYVFHSLVSEEKQSTYMNSFAYLFNLYLIGLPPKYVLLLDERQTHDRNKTVAGALYEKIKSFTGREIQLDEHQIADCFAKTIRHRVEDAFNFWDKRKNGSRVRITSDAESVHYAKKLGLIPVPSRVREMMYSMVR